MLGHLGAILEQSGAMFGHLWAILGHLGASLGLVGALLWAILGHLEAISGPSWSILGPSWAILGPFWAILEAILGNLGLLEVYLKRETVLGILFPFVECYKELVHFCFLGLHFYWMSQGICSCLFPWAQFLAGCHKEFAHVCFLKLGLFFWPNVIRNLIIFTFLDSIFAECHKEFVHFP